MELCGEKLALISGPAVFFFGKGIEGRVLSHKRPLGGKETQLLRDKLGRLKDKLKSVRDSAKPDLIRSPSTTTRG